ncbi:MAG: hypothetical protein EXR62_09455 [Chloroflexi bacterium]|nr:hypothetical protein [Chloroflexota bacterium]
MHKFLLNEAIITWVIEPDGPVLVKAGESGLDPTRPDMEFVRTWHQGRETVYLPGSSLKGVIRAQCERIARTLAAPESWQQPQTRLACNPLKDEISMSNGSCSEHFNSLKKKDEYKNKELPAPLVYRQSCFVCQLFGNTALGSRVRFTDAYPPTLEEYEQAHPQLKASWDQAKLARGERERQIVPTEERHGVAIDRVFGSVAVGPFLFEAATGGSFHGSIYLKNFTVAQLGLLALALRDLAEQRVLLGFAKSRGLGRVQVRQERVTLRYPGGEFLTIKAGTLHGIGALLPESVRPEYGLQAGDQTEVAGLAYQDDGWGGKEVTLTGSQAIPALWRACVPQWAQVVRQGR